MKKYLFFTLLIAATTILWSCGDSDDGTNDDPGATLAGTYVGTLNLFSEGKYPDNAVLIVTHTGVNEVTISAKPDQPYSKFTPKVIKGLSRLGNEGIVSPSSGINGFLVYNFNIKTLQFSSKKSGDTDGSFTGVRQ